MLTEGENEVCMVCQQCAQMQEKFVFVLKHRNYWKAGYSPISPAPAPTYSQRKQALGISSLGLISLQFLGVKSSELILLLFRTPSEFCFPSRIRS